MRPRVVWTRVRLLALKVEVGVRDPHEVAAIATHTRRHSVAIDGLVFGGEDRG